jgi:hypothetical protein
MRKYVSTYTYTCTFKSFRCFGSMIGRRGGSKPDDLERRVAAFSQGCAASFCTPRALRRSAAFSKPAAGSGLSRRASLVARQVKDVAQNIQVHSPGIGPAPRLVLGGRDRTVGGPGRRSRRGSGAGEGLRTNTRECRRWAFQPLSVSTIWRVISRTHKRMHKRTHTHTHSSALRCTPLRAGSWQCTQTVGLARAVVAAALGTVLAPGCNSYAPSSASPSTTTALPRRATDPAALRCMACCVG